MVAVQAWADEESQVAAVPPPQPSTTTKLSVSGGVTLSYRVSLTVDVKAKSDSGKASGGTEQKLIVDDACGVVAPGQVRGAKHGPRFAAPPVVRVLEVGVCPLPSRVLCLGTRPSSTMGFVVCKCVREMSVTKTNY